MLSYCELATPRVLKPGARDLTELLPRQDISYGDCLLAEMQSLELCPPDEDRQLIVPGWYGVKQ